MTSYLQMGWFWRGERARKAAEARPEMRTGEPAYSAVMSQSDPSAVLAEMKRTEALLQRTRRQARCRCRRARWFVTQGGGAARFSLLIEADPTRLRGVPRQD
jgi:hypothetical protein